ncbi:hypothetical protein KXS15_16855 [Sinorhizobium meliloti]|uniref:alpha/beta fold hydrolase n=1 Tax=Rhizobium meliloti TaxID=382 RepID=UPI003F15C8FA
MRAINPRSNFRLDRSTEWAPVEVESALNDLDIIPDRQVVYTVRHNGFAIPVFAYFRPGSGKLAAFGQDSLNRSRSVLPLFYRWSWYKAMPETSLIVFSDPTLMLKDDLGCGWYQGRPDLFAVDALVDVVREFARLLGIAAEDVLLFGTSAGGFWAMMAGAALQSRRVVADIPQVDLFSYHDREARDLMLTSCYGSLSMDAIRERFIGRLRVIDRFNDCRSAPQKIIYCQNARDVKHVRTQFVPFLSEVESLPADRRPNVEPIEYDRSGIDGRGHVPMQPEDMIVILNREQSVLASGKLQAAE